MMVAGSERVTPPVLALAVIWFAVPVMLVTPELVKVTEPPRATGPPPVSPVPGVTVIEGFANIALVTPPVAMEIVPVVVIGPPVKPGPVATFVTVPELAPGNVWPGAKVICPLDAIINPLSAIALPPEAVCRSRLPELFTNHSNAVGLLLASEPANCKG